RRAARAPHSGRIAPALRRELPPAARARLHRAAAAGFLEIRRRKTEHRGTETTTVPAAGRRARRRGTFPGIDPRRSRAVCIVHACPAGVSDALPHPSLLRNLSCPQKQNAPSLNERVGSAFLPSA